MRFSRRQVLFGIAGTIGAAWAARSLIVAKPVGPSSGLMPHTSDAAVRALDACAAIEARVGGRLGVCAVDTSNGDRLEFRDDELFSMCSTYKWLLVAAVLARIDRTELRLHDLANYASADLLEHAPTTRAHVGEGSLSVEELAKATITNSDNTAANLLLERVGGPAGLTHFFRQNGDLVTRLDRSEPTLNTNNSGDPRDTTSPSAMAFLMQALLCGDVLSAESRGRLLGWLRACETGRDRIRAGLPPHWTVGDKTGSGPHGAAHDIAIAFPPSRAPILIACYLSDSTSPLSALNAAHAEVGQVVATRFA